MKVPAGGSNCGNCKYLTKDGKHCGNSLFVQWYGTDKLPEPVNRYCSDYYEPSPEYLASGGKITKVRTGKSIEPLNAERFAKKREHIEQISNSIRSLRSNITKDLKSDDERTRLTALAISMIDKTYERVGNEESADNGHYGVTGFLKKDIIIIGNRVHLNYIGKSGVEHDKSFSDALAAKVLKQAIKDSPDKRIFVTSDGFKIKSDRVNRYLSEYDVTAKDLRGFHANKLIIDKLSKQDIPKEDKQRKVLFKKAVRFSADKVGHKPLTLQKHYLMPELQTEYVSNGKILNLSDFYSGGGEINDGNDMDTNDGKSGGILRGKSHAEGGIQAIVTDANKPVELEAEEIIINKIDAKENCELLSKINSKHGVSIPCDVQGNTTKFTLGGKIGSQYPIDDIDIEFNEYVIRAMMEKSIFGNKEVEANCRKILLEWDGYKYYPKIKDLIVVFRGNYQYNNSLTSFSTKHNIIYINSKKLSHEYEKRRTNRRSGLLGVAEERRGLESDNGLLRRSIHPRFFHELQHAIQRIEGTPISPSNPEFILSELKKQHGLSDMPDSNFKEWIENKTRQIYGVIEYKFYSSLPSEIEALRVEKEISSYYDQMQEGGDIKGKGLNLPIVKKEAMAENKLRLELITPNVKAFVPPHQLDLIAKGLRGEEEQYFRDILVEIDETTSKMPKTYETEGVSGKEKIAHLHYFSSGSDWYIVEKDSEPEQLQAFGYAILNGSIQDAEFGYINIEELKQIKGVELDLHWTAKKISDIISGKSVRPLITTPLVPQSDEYIKWEDEVTDIVGQILDAPRGDAQGVVEAQHDILEESWGRSLSPKNTAILITNGEVPDEKPIEEHKAELSALINQELKVLSYDPKSRVALTGIDSALFMYWEEIVSKHPEEITEFLSLQKKLPGKAKVMSEYAATSEWNEKFTANINKNLWTLIPEEFKQHKMPKKVGYKPEHADKGLHSIVKEFVGHDGFRLNLMGVHFDKEGITATDANKLLFLAHPADRQEGNFCITNDCLKANNGNETIPPTAKYPDYKRVVPDNTMFVTIHTESLITYLKTIIAIKYFHSTVTQVLVMVGEGDNKVEFGFNAYFLLDAAETMYKLGYDQIDIGYSAPSRPVTMCQKGKLKEVPKFTTDFVLVMPVLINGNIGFNRGIMYFNAETECVATYGIDDTSCINPVVIQKKEAEDTLKKTKAVLTEMNDTKVAEKLMLIESDVWDKLKISSGSQLYADYLLQKKYKAAMDAELEGKFTHELSKKVHDIIEDDNYHSLNQYLILSGDFGKKEENDWLTFLSGRTKEQNQYFLDTTPYRPEPIVPPAQALRDSISGLETMLEYAKGKEKKDLQDAIDGMKVMLDLMPEKMQGGGSIDASWGGREDFDRLYELFPDSHTEAKTIWNQLSIEQRDKFIHDLDVTDAASEHLSDSWLEFVNASFYDDWIENATNWDEMAKGGKLKRRKGQLA